MTHPITKEQLAEFISDYEYKKPYFRYQTNAQRKVICTELAQAILDKVFEGAVRAKLSFVPSELGRGITKTHLTFSHMAEDSSKLTAMENKSVLLLPAPAQDAKAEVKNV